MTFGDFPIFLYPSNSNRREQNKGIPLAVIPPLSCNSRLDITDWHWYAGCTKANLTNNTAAYAQELAREETAHVAFLYSALKANGGNPVCPQVNIGNHYCPCRPGPEQNLTVSAITCTSLFVIIVDSLVSDL